MKQRLGAAMSGLHGCVWVVHKTPTKILRLLLQEHVQRPSLGRGAGLVHVVRHDLRLAATAHDPRHGGALGAEWLLAKRRAGDFLLPKWTWGGPRRRGQAWPAGRLVLLHSDVLLTISGDLFELLGVGYFLPARQGPACS